MILVDRKLISKIIALTVGILCVYIAFNNNNSIFNLSGNIYGTTWKIVTDRYVDKTHIIKILNEVDLIASNYKSNSEVNVINQNISSNSLMSSDKLCTILKTAKNIEEESQGFYNISLGKISSNNGFSPKLNIMQRNLDCKRELYNWSVDNNCDVCIEDDNILDLSSIAKGFAVQEIHLFLQEKGYKNYLIDIGGEIIINGNKLSENWVIGIQNPSKMNESPAYVIKTTGFVALATSGEYRNFNLINDKKVSHTFNPFTMNSINNETLSVTVADFNSATVADAQATMLNAMGHEKALRLADDKGIKALFLVKSSEGLKVIKSKKLYDSEL